jgi:hypothetical protein
MTASASRFSGKARSSSTVPRAGVLAAWSDDYGFAMHEKWDGRSAKALSSTVVARAERLVVRFAGLRHLVEVAPGKDGSLSLVWDDGAGNYVYLDVGPDDTVHLFYDVLGKPKWEGVSVATDLRLLAQMAAAFEFLRPRQAPQFIAPRADTANWYAPLHVSPVGSVGYLTAVAA